MKPFKTNESAYIPELKQNADFEISGEKFSIMHWSGDGFVYCLRYFKSGGLSGKWITFRYLIESSRQRVRIYDPFN